MGANAPIISSSAALGNKSINHGVTETRRKTMSEITWHGLTVENLISTSVDDARITLSRCDDLDFLRALKSEIEKYSKGQSTKLAMVKSRIKKISK